MHRDETLDHSRFVTNRCDVKGDPVEFAGALCIEKFGAHRAAGPDLLTQPSDLGLVGRWPLQDMARHLADDLGQRIASVPGERCIAPFHTAHGVGDQHQVIGVVGNQRHPFELVLGQLLLRDIAQGPDEPLPRHQHGRHFHPAKQVARAAKPQQRAWRMIGRLGSRQCRLKQVSVLGPGELAE